MAAKGPTLDGLPAGDPTELGLDAGALEAFAAGLEEKYIRSGRLPGAALVVVRRGKVALLRTWGGFRSETVVKLFSVSKVLTAIATLQLVEEGRIGLEDAVSDRVPEWPAAPLVEDSSGAVRPAKLPLTVRHCLTHTSGGTYFMPVVHPASTHRPSERRRLAAVRRGDQPKPRDLRGAVAADGAEPLLFEPGTRFNYSGLDACLLGRVIEEVSGLNIHEHLRQKLFLPAGMGSTGFVISQDLKKDCVPVHIHPEAVPSFAAGAPQGTCWQWFQVSALRLIAAVARLVGRPKSLPLLPAGNAPLEVGKMLWDPELTRFQPDAGIVSTVADFTRLLVVLTGKSTQGPIGPAARAALAEPATPEVQAPFALDPMPSVGQLMPMESDPVCRRADTAALRPMNSLPGQRFSLGACVVSDPAKAGLSERCAGSWHWCGLASTYFFVNPREELAACFLTQLLTHRTYPLAQELMEGVHGCLV